MLRPENIWNGPDILNSTSLCSNFAVGRRSMRKCNFANCRCKMCDCLGPLWNQGGLTCFLRKDHPYLGHVRTATEGKAAEKKHWVIQSVSRQIHGSMPIFLAWSISQNQKIFEKTGARVLFKIGFRLDWSSSNTWKCAIGHDVPIRRVTRFRIMVNSYSQCDSGITCPNNFVNAWLIHHLVGKICVSLMRRESDARPQSLTRHDSAICFAYFSLESTSLS